jgi:N-acetylneuraminic acid mutarotase
MVGLDRSLQEGRRMHKFVEDLEPRRLLSAVPSALPVAEVTAKGAAAYEDGPRSRFFYIRRSGETSEPLIVRYVVGGKARQGIDYEAIGDAVTIKPGNWLRRVEVKPIDDSLEEPNEAVTLTLVADAAYDIHADKPAATIRIISNDEIAEPVPTTIGWETKAPSPIIRAEALRAVVDNKLYVFGGFSGDLGPVQTSHVFDPSPNTWTPITSLPTRLTHAGVAVDGSNVYVVGGYVGTAGKTGYEQTFGVKQVWRYNVDDDGWASMPDLPKGLAGGGAAVVGRTLHSFGGNDTNRQDVGDHYVLNLDDTGAGWKTAAAMPDPRSHFGTVVLGNRIYAIGGQHGNDADLTTVTTVSRYDADQNQWTTLAPLPVAVSHIASAAVVINNRIIVAGGETAHETPTNRVTLYDPATNQWSSLTPLPAARFSGVMGVLNDTLYFTTGSSETTTWKGVLS